MERRDYESELNEIFYNLSPTKVCWFRHSECDPDRILRNMNAAHAELLAQRDSEYGRGVIKLLITDFVREAWVSEVHDAHVSNEQTVEIATILAEDGTRPDFCPEEAWRTISSLLRATYTELLNSSDVFDVDRVKMCNEQVMQGLLYGAGTLRVREVGDTGTGIRYAPASKVLSRLRTLMDFVQRERAKGKEPMRRLKIATVFLSEFLKLHPFMDGNGRTARLLVCAMLADTCGVPCSLYLDGDRDTYLKVLQEAQWHNNASTLLTYILSCMEMNSAKALWLLMD